MAAASAFSCRCWARHGSRPPKASCSSLKTSAPSPTRSTACCGNCAMRASSTACAASSSAKCSIALSPGAPPDLLEEVILHAFTDCDIPIAIGLRSGHVSRHNVTLTFGVEAELQTTRRQPQLHLLEPAVTPMTATPRHIHLSGICGTAMASLAGLLQLQGHRITGLRQGRLSAHERPAALAWHSGDGALRRSQSRSRAGPGRHRQRALARQSRSGAHSRPAHSLHLHGRAAARGVPHRPRVARRSRHARQNHHHQHAGVDLPGCRAR